MDYIWWFYVFCSIVAVFTLMVYISLIPIRKKVLGPLPRALRLHFIATILPFSILTTLCSFIITIFYFLDGTETSASVGYEAMRFTLTFTSQMLRIAYLLIVLERIVATVYLEKYAPYSAGYSGFFVLTFASYFTTGLYLIPALSWIVSPVLRVLYLNLLYFVVAMHIVTMIVCKILQLKNRRMYRLLAYRVTLERRCEILENIKVTAALWNPILIFAVIGPIGLVIKSAGTILNHDITFAVVHLFYNISFATAIIQRHVCLRPLENVLVIDEKTVMSPLGISLPATVSVDHYFADLKHQWS